MWSRQPCCASGRGWQHAKGAAASYSWDPGVGKTELAKALANLLFDDEKMMVSHGGKSLVGFSTWGLRIMLDVLLSVSVSCHILSGVWGWGSGSGQ